MAVIKELWRLGGGRWQCQKITCRHVWESRKEPEKPPLSCPRCKSYSWRGTVVVAQNIKQ